MLDTQDLSLLSSDDQTEARWFEKFFESEEWLHLAKELESQVETEKERILLANSWDANRVCTGKLLAYASLLNYPAIKTAEFSNKAIEASMKVEDAIAEVELEHE